MENIEINYVLRPFMHSSHKKLTYIFNLHDKLEQHWLILRAILEQKYFSKQEESLQLDNGKHKSMSTTIKENNAASIIQAWWRGLSYRRSMLEEHKEKLKSCVLQVRDAPCSEENPKDERSEPLNQRILRYLEGLLSTVLTERKVMALRLTDSSHVAIESMLRNKAISTILECISDMNRSVAHLYVIRPLCSLLVKLLSYKPFAVPFVNECLDKLLSNAIHQIHNNYNDSSIVMDQINIIKELSFYTGFADKMKALHFDWFMQKYKQNFAKLKTTDPRFNAFRFLCNLQRSLKNNVAVKK